MIEANNSTSSLSANLAIDLAWMYEFDETQERFNLYQKVNKTFSMASDS